MRFACSVLLFFSLVSDTFAQENLGEINRSGFISLSSYYQSWEVANTSTFNELSTPVFLYLPFGYAFHITAHASYASISGNRVQEISGFTDTQITLNYHFENANLLLTLGLNLPSGKKELTLDEFLSSGLISYSVFKFRVPNFGEGFGIAPGFTWALPLSDNIVAGIGATYQRKEGFRPLDTFNAEYDPGDEMLFTAGLDFRLNNTTTLSTDAIFTSFRTDKVGPKEIFASGSKWIFHVQFRKFFNFNELWLFARYRSRAKNRLVQAGRLFDEKEKTTPDQVDVMAHYRLRLRQRMYFRILAEARFFQETSSDFSGATLFGLGLMPEFSLSKNLVLPVRFLFFSGSLKNDIDLSGFEAGLGLTMRF
jgi:hypothetical protein